MVICSHPVSKQRSAFKKMPSPAAQREAAVLARNLRRGGTNPVKNGEKQIGPFTQNYPNARFPDDFVSRFRRFIAKSLGLHLPKLILVAFQANTTIYLHFWLAMFLYNEKIRVAQKLCFSCKLLIKCPGQIEAMGHRIISCFCQTVGFDW